MTFLDPEGLTTYIKKRKLFLSVLTHEIIPIHSSLVTGNAVASIFDERSEN